MEFRDIKKILVIKLRHIGDVLLISPTIRALKENFPEAEVSVLVNSGTEEVLSGLPAISDLMVFDRKIKKLPGLQKYLKELQFYREIRSKRFDMTVDLTGGDRAALVSFISGARYRIGLDPGRRGFAGKRRLYTHHASPDNRKHMVLQNLDIIRQFGIKTENMDVDFFIPEAARESVRTIFKKNNISAEDTVVHVHPTSRWLHKCWNDAYMAEVIRWLLEKGTKVVVTASPDKKEMGKTGGMLSLVSEQGNEEQGLIDLCGKTSIKELGAISAASDIFIGVDTAPMHIAAAVKTPVIALFGPSGHFGEWYPYGDGHIVLTKDLPCKPCGKGMCEGVRIRDCMKAIKPYDVKKAVNEMEKKRARKMIDRGQLRC